MIKKQSDIIFPTITVFFFAFILLTVLLSVDSGCNTRKLEELI